MNVSYSLEQLTQILSRESIQCDLLAQNILQEREAIKRMALHEFLSINQSRITILDRLGSLKEELDECIRDLGAIYHIPEASRTVPEVLRRAQGHHNEAILRQYEGLAEKVRAVKQDIAVNQLLIHNVQSFLTRAAEVHRQGAEDNELYSASGIRGEVPHQAVLLQRKG